MNPPYVTMSFTPEEALEVAQAVKAAKDVKSQRVIKPLNPKNITVKMLAEACVAAGISTAKLIQG